VVDFMLERAPYLIIIALMMAGLYITFQSENLIKRMVGLAVFQSSVCLFYVALGKVAGGTAPILLPADMTGAPALSQAYANPLPHVLMLTAIVVGVSTLSVGLAIAVRIREAYGTVEADEVAGFDFEAAATEADAAASAAREAQR
jgi:multicomponent Na+:H+ antiporter subunit C